MTTPCVRILKDFREYFLTLSQYNDIAKNELNMISTDYNYFCNHIIRSVIERDGYLDNDNINDILRCISMVLKMVNPLDELEIKIREQIYRLHRDLFL